jgi:hypothetical protein
MPADAYAGRLVAELARYGLVPGNTLLILGLCRDELCAHVADQLQAAWGPAFNIGSLGGVPFCGRTGLSAALHHLPSADGRRRYASVVMPHIGIDENGVAGLVHRPGQAHASSACGALVGLRDELAAGVLKVEPDVYDPEMSLLRSALLSKTRFGTVPDIVSLTRTARDVAMEKYLDASGTLDHSRDNDVAVCSGIIIHGPDGQDWVEPGRAFARYGPSRLFTQIDV